MIEKAIPITECSPNSMGVYGKTIAFVAMIFAGAERFSHLVYLGNKEVLARIFGVKRLPDAPREHAKPGEVCEIAGVG